MTHRLHMLHNLERLHQSHGSATKDVEKAGRKEAISTMLMFFESALTGVVIFTSNLVKWNLFVKNMALLQGIPGQSTLCGWCPAT